MEFEEFKLFESEHDLRGRMNNLSCWRKIQAWLEIEPWLFAMTGRIALSGHRQGLGSIPGQAWIFSTALVVHSTARIMFTLCLYQQLKI